MTLTTANAIKTPTNSISLSFVDYSSKKASTTGYIMYTFSIANLITELTSLSYTKTVNDLITITFANPLWNTPTKCFIKSGLSNSTGSSLKCSI